MDGSEFWVQGSEVRVQRRRYGLKEGIKKRITNVECRRKEFYLFYKKETKND
jgi:hypothetical protein